MRIRQCAMTLLLVLTLLTNLGHYERGNVLVSGEVENEIASKRRILERLIRLGLASSDPQPMYPQQFSSQQHLFPATSNEESDAGSIKTFRPLGSSLLQWFHSNHIPSSRQWGQEEETYPATTVNRSVVNELSNLFYPMSSDSQQALPLLLRQYDDLSENLEDSLLRRRHAEESTVLPALSPKELKKQRKREKQLKREEKKKKRNNEKRKRKKENKRFQDILKDEDITLHNVDGEEYLDCCPSKLIVVEIQVGKDRNNHAVEVRPSHQYFYERVCLQDIEDSECVFPARSLRKGVVTRCAQQFSYVQAQVRPYRSDSEWHFDYIYVRSGCSCQVSVSKKAKIE